MGKPILNDLEHLKQNYRPSDIQKLLNDSKTKREVYHKLKVSEYGFIEPSDKSRDVFVHISAVQHLDIRKLDPGTKVSFETEKQYGKLSATNIKLI